VLCCCPAFLAAAAAAALVQFFGPVLTGQIVRALGPDLTGGWFGEAAAMLVMTSSTVMWLSGMIRDLISSCAALPND
jgi:hypothetical protein